MYIVNLCTKIIFFFAFFVLLFRIVTRAVHLMTSTGVTAVAMIVNMAASMTIPTVINTLTPSTEAAVVMAQVLMAISQEL